MPSMNSSIKEHHISKFVDFQTILDVANVNIKINVFAFFSIHVDIKYIISQTIKIGNFFLLNFISKLHVKLLYKN
jgi:hypothetical protein